MDGAVAIGLVIIFAIVAAEKKAEALKRNPPGPAPAPSATAGAIGATDASQDWKCLICGEVSATRVAAESHVRGSHPPAPVETSVGPV